MKTVFLFCLLPFVLCLVQTIEDAEIFNISVYLYLGYKLSSRFVIIYARYTRSAFAAYRLVLSIFRLRNGP